MDPSRIQENINLLKPKLIELESKSRDVKYVDDIELLDLLDKLITKFQSSEKFNITFQPTDFDEQNNLFYRLKSILLDMEHKGIVTTVVFGMGPVVYFRIIEKNGFLEEINKLVIDLSNIPQQSRQNIGLTKKEMTINQMRAQSQIDCKFESNKYLLSKLHPEIRKASGKLFLNKHYPQAIFDATKRIEIMVKEKSKIDKSGKDLMLLVFSKNDPILCINNCSNRSEIDEQEGFMHLFAGLMQGIKDPKSHSEIKLNDSQKCIEYLCLCSLLARKIEESKLKE